LKKNSIDTIIDRLKFNLSKVEGFNKLFENQLGEDFYHYIIKVQFELKSFESLFLQYYIPASRKSIVDFKRELKFSKYKNEFNLSNEELKENYYETIRLGYVGISHKFESYIKNLIKLTDEFSKLTDFDNNLLPIVNFTKKHFNRDLNKISDLNSTTKKINWICNCVKHYDGLPVKEPVHYLFQSKDKSKKIQIESSEFKEDINSLRENFLFFIQLFFLISMYQTFMQADENILKQLKKGFSIEQLELTRSNIKKAIEKLLS